MHGLSKHVSRIIGGCYGLLVTCVRLHTMHVAEVFYSSLSRTCAVLTEQTLQKLTPLPRYVDHTNNRQNLPLVSVHTCPIEPAPILRLISNWLYSMIGHLRLSTDSKASKATSLIVLFKGRI